MACFWNRHAPDANVWYSFQNDVSGLYLGGSIGSNGSERAVTLTTQLDGERSLWQLATISAYEKVWTGYSNQTFYLLRPKAYGLAQMGDPGCCLSVASCQTSHNCSLSLAPCGEGLLTWHPHCARTQSEFVPVISYSVQGSAFVTYFLSGYEEDAVVVDDHTRYGDWRVSSVAFIDDQRWSTYRGLNFANAGPATGNSSTNTVVTTSLGSSSSPSPTHAQHTTMSDWQVTGRTHIGSTQTVVPSPKTSSSGTRSIRGWSGRQKSGKSFMVGLFLFLLTGSLY